MNDGKLHFRCNFPTFIQKALNDNLTPDGGLIFTKMNLVNSLRMVVLKVLDISPFFLPHNSYHCSTRPINQKAWIIASLHALFFENYSRYCGEGILNETCFTAMYHRF
jgi:hypothetical protein